mmetsp:Transcript_47518/g.106704  ORF Transcript_47518/g.106704 Transcript_47518/m.106704 type:complete len:423 (-) Transcript_47518:24-1292(-)
MDSGSPRAHGVEHPSLFCPRAGSVEGRAFLQSHFSAAEMKGICAAVGIEREAVWIKSHLIELLAGYAGGTLPVFAAVEEYERLTTDDRILIQQGQWGYPAPAIADCQMGSACLQKARAGSGNAPMTPFNYNELGMNGVKFIEGVQADAYFGLLLAPEAPNHIQMHAFVVVGSYLEKAVVHDVDGHAQTYHYIGFDAFPARTSVALGNSLEGVGAQIRPENDAAELYFFQASHGDQPICLTSELESTVQSALTRQTQLRFSLNRRLLCTQYGQLTNCVLFCTRLLAAFGATLDAYSCCAFQAVDRPKLPGESHDNSLQGAKRAPRASAKLRLLEAQWNADSVVEESAIDRFVQGLQDEAVLGVQRWRGQAPGYTMKRLMAAVCEPTGGAAEPVDALAVKKSERDRRFQWFLYTLGVLARLDLG